MTGLCFHILGIIIPIDELICFRGVETTKQIDTYSKMKELVGDLTYVLLSILMVLGDDA